MGNLTNFIQSHKISFPTLNVGEEERGRGGEGERGRGGEGERGRGGEGERGRGGEGERGRGGEGERGRGGEGERGRGGGLDSSWIYLLLCSSDCIELIKNVQEHDCLVDHF